MIGHILKVDIQYKHLIIGFPETNNYLKCKNLLLSYITYSIYRLWIICENEKQDMNKFNLCQYLKQYLLEKSCIIQEKNFRSQCDKIILNL